MNIEEFISTAQQLLTPAPTQSSDAIVKADGKHASPVGQGEASQDSLTLPVCHNAIASIDEVPLSEIPWVGYTTSHKPYIRTQQLFRLLSSPQYENRILTVKRDNSPEPAFAQYRSGYYHWLSYTEVKGAIKELMPTSIRRSQDWESIFQEFLTECPKYRESQFNADEDIICFQNGVLHLSTDELTPHSSEYLVTAQIPCDYVPGLTWAENSLFKKFLDTLVSNDPSDKALIMEYIGAALSNVPGYRFKRCLWLYGPGNTGKSVLRELVVELLGADNVQAIDLRRLSGRFGPGRLYGKRLAGSGDMASRDIAELDIVKQLTGGDQLFAEDKGKDGFTFKYRGLLWFNANKLPQFGGDRGEHVFNRLMILPCNNVIPPEEQDPTLLDKLLAERVTIVSQAVSHLRNAISRGYKFSEGPSIHTSRENYQRMNSSLATFIDEYCQVDRTGHSQYRTPRATFNKAYNTWCRNNGLVAERPSDIKTALKELGVSTKKIHGIYNYTLALNVNDVLGNDSSLVHFIA